MWVLVRRVMLVSVLRQATDLRGQTTAMRRAWYFTGVGSRARDAKEIRVFGLARFAAGMYREEFTAAIRAGHAGLRDMHRRAAGCFAGVLAGYGLALLVITDAARTHQIGLRSLAILLPMLAVSMAAGSISFDDITLAWTLAGLPDVDHLEQELVPSAAGPELEPSQAAGPGAGIPAGLPRDRVRFEAVTYRYPGGATDVLSGVDLELRAGTSTALVGVNGAGKSTLVSLLARLRDPTEGRILVDGQDIRDLDPARWQRAIALMPQSPVRFPTSARAMALSDRIAVYRTAHPGTQRLVLTHLSLDIPAGTTVAVVGENGSGKTTLVKLLLGMYAPSSGTIMVDDAPLPSLSPASWRSRCSAAFQDYSRFSLPAVSSVGMGEVASHASEPLALAALGRAGAADLVGQLPSGLGTRVGGPYTGGHNLSGGQWQKVALGRAMRRPDPLLVVLDEPTASLDAHAEHELFTRYASAAAALAASAGTITLLVSHRFSTVRMADLIVYLDQGSVAEAGSHSSLMAAGGRYAEAFTLQAAGYE
jgi:ABC-type multidrug transport system fused ATPase/permease subunit